MDFPQKNIFQGVSLIEHRDLIFHNKDLLLILYGLSDCPPCQEMQKVIEMLLEQGELPSLRATKVMMPALPTERFDALKEKLGLRVFPTLRLIDGDVFLGDKLGLPSQSLKTNKTAISRWVNRKVGKNH